MCADYRLQEEIKKAKVLADDLASHQTQLQAKTTLSDELQTSLVSLKEELSTTLQRFEQTKRHLEDQLIEEERAREEMQEQNLEFRKTNKRLVKELEAMQRNPSKALESAHGKGAPDVSSAGQAHASTVTPAEMKGIMRKRLDDLQCQLEWSQMRENDLLGLLRRHDAARAAAQAKPTPVRRMLSRMPSTTVITRFVPNADSDAAKASVGSSRDSGGAGGGMKRSGGGSARGQGGGGKSGNATLASSGDSADENDGDSFDDGEFAGPATLEIDEKNFEAYHQEVHRMLTEIEEGRSKNQKQQKTITVRALSVCVCVACACEDGCVR